VVEMPAYCPDHGEFPSGFVIEDTLSVTLSGNQSSCPVCGRLCPVIEGTFNIRGGLIEVLAAPGWTVRKIRRAQQALAAAQADMGQAEADTGPIEAVDPALAQWFRRATKGWTRDAVLALLTLLVAVLALYLQERRAAKGDVSEERLREIVESELHEPDDPTAPSGPTPTKRTPPATP
jgi:hypothetical protein